MLVIYSDSTARQGRRARDLVADGGEWKVDGVSLRTVEAG